MSQKTIYQNADLKRCNYCAIPLKFESWTEDKNYCRYSDCSYSFSNFKNAITKAKSSDNMFVRQTAQWAEDQLNNYLNASNDEKTLLPSPKQFKPIFHMVVKRKEKLFIKRMLSSKKQQKILQELKCRVSQ